MTLYSKVGTFTTPTSTGNQTVSGIGFTPVAVIIWGIADDGNGWVSDSQFGMGFSAYNSAKSAFQQGATSTAGASGVTTRQTLFLLTSGGYLGQRPQLAERIW
jgi:hypothetical protein